MRMKFDTRYKLNIPLPRTVWRGREFERDEIYGDEKSRRLIASRVDVTRKSWRFAAATARPASRISGSWRMRVDPPVDGVARLKIFQRRRVERCKSAEKRLGCRLNRRKNRTAYPRTDSSGHCHIAWSPSGGSACRRFLPPISPARSVTLRLVPFVSCRARLV